MKDTIKDIYKKSKEEYENYVKKNKRIPTEQEWNEIAKKSKLLSNMSMRYIGHTRFKKRIF